MKKDFPNFGAPMKRYTPKQRSSSTIRSFGCVDFGEEERLKLSDAIIESTLPIGYTGFASQ